MSLTRPFNRLLDAILFRLHQSPCTLLGDLALELQVSRRTIKNSIRIAVGKTFRDLRKEILLNRIKDILVSNSEASVKELAFAVGFKSASSFSRAVKRSCGSSPQELRSRALDDSTEFS